MSTLPGVGNDVVDLKEPENIGKSGDDRFLGRVFTARELEGIAGADSPDALLWALWAAKEAAYKAVSGGDPSVCSIPRRYRVLLLDKGDASGTIDPAQKSEGRLAGRVITPRGEVALRITVTGDYVHAVAAGSDAVLTGVIQRVERIDCAGDAGGESAFVRWLLLHEIAGRLNCPVADLALLTEPGSDAPRVFLRDRPLAADISLSHDGRFAAFALAFT